MQKMPALSGTRKGDKNQNKATSNMNQKSQGKKWRHGENEKEVITGHIMGAGPKPCNRVER